MIKMKTELENRYKHAGDTVIIQSSWDARWMAAHVIDQFINDQLDFVR